MKNYQLALRFVGRAFLVLLLSFFYIEYPAFARDANCLEALSTKGYTLRQLWKKLHNKEAQLIEDARNFRRDYSSHQMAQMEAPDRAYVLTTHFTPQTGKSRGGEKMNRVDVSKNIVFRRNADLEKRRQKLEDRQRGLVRARGLLNSLTNDGETNSGNVKHERNRIYFKEVLSLLRR